MDKEAEVTSAIELASIIRKMIKDRVLLTASFNQGKDSMTTLLLDADPARDTLVFDGSRDEAINRNIVAAMKVIFSGSPQGTKVRFASSGVKAIKYHGEPAFSIKFPSSLMRFQNRDAFRVGAEATFCTLPMPGRGSAKVPVKEISVGGAMLILNHATDNFTLGQVISGCQLDLGSQGRINCSLEVRGLKRLPSRMTGMGCRFVGMSKANEGLLARFVAQQERKSIAKSNNLFSL